MAVANAIMIAARTAPKARGVDDIGIAAITGEEKDKLAVRMRAIATEQNRPSFELDAVNVDHSIVVILIGACNRVRALDCTLCGYPTCAGKLAEEPLTQCPMVIAAFGEE